MKKNLVVLGVMLLVVISMIPVSSNTFNSPESTPIVVTPIQPTLTPTITPTPFPYRNYIPQVYGQYDFNVTPTPTPRPTCPPIQES